MWGTQIGQLRGKGGWQWRRHRGVGDPDSQTSVRRGWMTAETQWKVGDPDWPTLGEGGLAVAKTQGSGGPRFANFERRGGRGDEGGGTMAKGEGDGGKGGEREGGGGAVTATMMGKGRGRKERRGPDLVLRVWVDGEDARGAVRSVFGTGAKLGNDEDAGGAKLGDDEGWHRIMWVEERGGCEFTSLSLSLFLSYEKETGCTINQVSSLEYIGIGMVTRDKYGVVTSFLTRQFFGKFPPHIGEYLAVREGVCLAKVFGLDNWMVKLDALNTVSTIHNPITGPPKVNVVEDIRDSLLTARSGIVCYISHDGNRVAHLLAKYAISSSVYCFGIDYVPRWLGPIVKTDLVI
ncbi:hypothetical protein TIFTF001_031208 [Ficus carica]|uniref:RNase H type-1 domain-containing protein n=1 Tax=Ficus carica TaxID=3494 RepID=A0AA88DUM5_FICCA|nr:hypothetical protein TIFTF001_031208 [Ficus carica]